MMVKRVLIADDHGVVRKGLRYLLESREDIEVAGEASDGISAIKLAQQEKPDIVIMDVAMPGINGIDAASQIVKDCPDTRVIMLSMHDDESYLTRSLAAGAKGYLLKDSADDDLLRAITAVAGGDSYFSPAMVKTLVDHYLDHKGADRSSDPYESLTDREKQVLLLLAHGKTNKEVANLLNLSVYTVETHRAHLMQKLDLHNTAEIVLFAVKRKLIM